MTRPANDKGRIDPERRRLLQAAAGLSLAPWPTSLWSAEGNGPVAETAYGRVRGSFEGPVAVFRGIPYGADTASTRFRRPRPPPGWSGVREAKEYGPRCPQPPRRARGPRKLLQSWAIPQQESEDCLYLNIWTSGLSRNSGRPVMVWLHGGGFATGSGAATAYEGNRLVEKGDVVVVTLNHRLNIFGYLCLAEFDDEFADSGNVGQFDLVAALRWIRDNIAEFGGNPDNVTIFGESGGGAKVSTLMAMEEAHGLFHRAVIQSGPMLWASELPSATATGRIGAQALGATNGQLRNLDSASTTDVISALDGIRTEGRFRTLAPVVDGRGLSRHPFDPDASSQSAEVPLLIGNTATESTFLLGFDESLFNLDWDGVLAKLARYTTDFEYGPVVAGYRKLYPSKTPSDIFFDISTMYMIGRSTLRIADRKAAQGAASVWVYELRFESDIDDGKWRSPHTFDIPLVFDNVQKSLSMFADPERAQPIADAMSDTWLAFARHGHAGWRPWSAAQPTRLFGSGGDVVDGPRKSELQLLRDLPYWDITKPNDL